MREIKVRIWDKKNKIWVIKDSELSLCRLFEDWYFATKRFVRTPENTYLHESDYKIQQFTGLTDSAGKEVWEGDIVCEKMTNDIAFEGGECNLGRVFFAVGSFMIDGDGPLYDHTHSLTPDKLEDYLVVGNVFENPDLLK